MNIKNIESKQKNVKDVLGKVWEKQAELVGKYKEIENIKHLPLDLDLAEDQILIKDFKQRILEELAEAYEAFIQKDMEHFYEEIIDVLHFAVELNILCDLKSKDFEVIDGASGCKDLIECNELMELELWNICYRYGLLSNSLKNKPWKQSQILTDRKKFYELLKKAFRDFIVFMLRIGLSADDIFNYYLGNMQSIASA